MGTLWEDVKKTVKEVFTVAVEKTEEYGKIGKVKVEILKLERDCDKALRDLGDEMYSLLKKDKTLAGAQNDKVKKIIAKLDNLTKLLKAKDNEIEKIKKEADKKTRSAKSQTATTAKTQAKKTVTKKTPSGSTKKKA